jgi:hypothetical protein
MGNFSVFLPLGAPPFSLEHNNVHSIAARFNEDKLWVVLAIEVPVRNFVHAPAGAYTIGTVDVNANTS